jgi:hypothetical protein
MDRHEWTDGSYEYRLFDGGLKWRVRGNSEWGWAYFDGGQPSMSLAGETRRLAARVRELEAEAGELASAADAVNSALRETRAGPEIQSPSEIRAGIFSLRYALNRHHARLARLDALMASEEVPEELSSAVLGREGMGPATAAWRWIREQLRA